MSEHDDSFGLLGLSDALADALADAEKLADSKDQHIDSSADGDSPDLDDSDSSESDDESQSIPSAELPASSPNRTKRRPRPVGDGRLIQLQAQFSRLERELNHERGSSARLRKEIEQAKADLKVTRQRFLRQSDQVEAMTAQLDRAQRSLPINSRQKFVKQWIPALDTTVRVLGHLIFDDKVAPEVRQALELLRVEWQRAFDVVDLEVIEATGESFDPQQHEAISRRHEPGVDSGVVLEQVDPGYRLAGHLLRSAQVVVSEDA
ncbi:MAG: nucleotide exchange factor GrpE [Myxococcales bacterium]|nr:nucleotide exchange factor GrpE [Myxococcales bacterium]